MESFRKNFYQALLVILALAFAVCIWYLSENKSVNVGTFGTSEKSNITITDVFTTTQRKGGNG